MGMLARPAAAAEPRRTRKDAADMKAYTEKIPRPRDVKFDMVPIPGGKFIMGSPEKEKGHKNDEGPQHEVTISPFWMGKCPK